MESNSGLYTFIANVFSTEPSLQLLPHISYDKHIQYSSWLKYETLHL